MADISGVCTLCGGLARHPHSCHLCGAIVCEKCYDAEKGLCKKCAEKARV
ncbi:MAG: orotate phosphoribosyltransferase [Candidatus Aenigmarchaeota archaeon]